jgi:hypothetical protein
MDSKEMDCCFTIAPNLPASKVLSKLQLNNEYNIRHINIGGYIFSNHNTQDMVFQDVDNSMISFQAYIDMIFMFSIIQAPQLFN